MAGRVPRHLHLPAAATTACISKTQGHGHLRRGHKCATLVNKLYYCMHASSYMWSQQRCWTPTVVQIPDSAARVQLALVLQCPTYTYIRETNPQIATFAFEDDRRSDHLKTGTQKYTFQLASQLHQHARHGSKQWRIQNQTKETDFLVISDGESISFQKDSIFSLFFFLSSPLL